MADELVPKDIAPNGEFLFLPQQTGTPVLSVGLSLTLYG